MEKVDKIEKDMEQLEEKKKVYRSGSKSYSLENISREIYRDSSFQASEKIKNEAFPVILDLISIDNSNFPDEIQLKAIVTDTTGKYIKGLAEPYFEGTGTPFDYWVELYDSCKNSNHKIKDYNIKEIRRNIAEPFAIHFVLDHSPSMTHQRALYLQQTIKSVLFAVKPQDRIAITKFSRNIINEVEFTDDKDKYINDFVVDGLKGGYGDGTAYFDAIVDAIYSFEEVPDSFKKIIISFTDGEDNLSKSTPDSVKLLSREKNVEIYSIAYGFAEDIVKEIAEYSGGRYYFIISSKEFPYVFRDIYLLLNNYYLITYKPPGCKDLHKVKLNLIFPDINMEMISDFGYYDQSIFSPMDPIGTKAIANIEFDYDSDVIKSESIYIIEEIAEIMKRHNDLKLMITGHTDNIGNEEYNLELSKSRALSVKKALLEMGISEKRLTTKGVGENEPVAPNNTEENRRKNTRTEFTIIK